MMNSYTPCDWAASKERRDLAGFENCSFSLHQLRKLYTIHRVRLEELPADRGIKSGMYQAGNVANGLP